MKQSEVQKVLQLIQGQFQENVGNKLTPALGTGMMNLIALELNPLVEKEEEKTQPRKRKAAE